MKKQILLLCVLLLSGFPFCSAQVKPRVSLVGGDEVPALKQQCEQILENLLLEMNRINKGTGEVSSLRSQFSRDAFEVFQKYVAQNRPYTARKKYEPLMIQREHGAYYDIRSIAVRVELGETESSDLQNLVFTYSADGKIVSVRAILPNYDFETVVAEGKTPEDSLMRAKVLDFLERFRMAYNAKDAPFLEMVYSDEALILVGTVLQEKPNGDNFRRMSLLSTPKVKLIQQTKREYLNALKSKAFKANSFINVRFENVQILQHEKTPYIYGVSCWQQWNSSTYSDRGYLFLMMDFRQPDTPTVHVRSWQPTAFDDGSYVDLYDFDVVEYK